MLKKILVEYKLLSKYSWQSLYGPVIYITLSCIAYWIINLIANNAWQTIAPTLMILIATISLLLSLQTGFLFDMQYNALNLWCIKQHNILQQACIRLIIFYLINMLPMAISSYILGIILHIPIATSLLFFIIWSLSCWLILGIGLIISALTPILRIRSNLLILISIPFYIPILLWSIGAIHHQQMLLNNDFECYILLGSALLSTIIFPKLLSIAIKIGVDN